MAGTKSTMNDWTQAQKNKRFAELYVIDCGYDATAAYRRLWLEIQSDKDASQLPKSAKRMAYVYRHKPAVEKLIHKLEEKIAESQEIRRNETIWNLREIAFDKEQPNSDRLKAIDLLNKMGGFYTDNVNVSGEQTIELVIE